jgi:hypothetical protein
MKMACDKADLCLACLISTSLQLSSQDIACAIIMLYLGAGAPK